jgi:hypothetical protein
MVTPKNNPLAIPRSEQQTKSFCSPNFGRLFSVSGGYYKQEQTPGGYQDALKIHNHSSQRIEKTNNWYKKPLVLS